MAKIPDVLKVENSGYSLIMENDRVRVMEMQLEPGQKSPMHNHPNDHVVYVFKDANFKLSFPNNESAEFQLEAGKVLWIDAGPHETENIGSTQGHNLVMELK